MGRVQVESSGCARWISSDLHDSSRMYAFLECSGTHHYLLDLHSSLLHASEISSEAFLWTWSCWFRRCCWCFGWCFGGWCFGRFFGRCFGRSFSRSFCRSLCWNLFRGNSLYSCFFRCILCIEQRDLHVTSRM